MLPSRHDTVPQCVRAASLTMNDADPQAWLADVLSRIATYPAHRLDDLLPWNWMPKLSATVAAAA